MKTIHRISLCAALVLASLSSSTPPARAAAVTEAWVQRYNGPANSYDGAQAIAMDGSGNVLVTGYSYDFSGAIYTAKYAAADGALLWEKRDHGLMNIETGARALAVDASGNVVVAGYSHNGHNFDYYTAKYAAADGALLWRQHYGPGDSDSALAVAVDGSGNVVVTGNSGSFYTAKYAAADGALLWEKRSPGLFDSATAMALDGSGNVVVTGRSHNSSGGLDYYTAKYATADGALLWEQRYNGPRNSFDYANAVAVDRSGNVVVTGISGFDYYTAKYAAADGTLLWEKSYDGLANRVYLAGSPSLSVGPDGVVAVTGTSSDDIVTILYRENQPPVISCPGNRTVDFSSPGGAVLNFTITATDDSGVPPAIDCSPPSGSVFPIGQTTVACTATDGDASSSACSFTVTVLGPRRIHEHVRAELVVLRAKLWDPEDRRKLDATLDHLSQSLASALWVDETHLQRPQGERVFQTDKEAVTSLCFLIKSKGSRISDAALEGFVDWILQADRLLAAVAIQDAITAGAPRGRIDQAERFLARGDADADDDKCANGLEDYRMAWRHANRP